MSRRVALRAALAAAAVVSVASVHRLDAAAQTAPGARPRAAAPAAGRADTVARKGAAAPTLAGKAAPDSVAEEKPIVMREVFAYEGVGRRDPFFPLISTAELRPFVSDLVLTSVLFDPTGRRSIAVMRDKTGNMQYRVTTGMLLGRMRVTDIRHRAVYFSIQEFGTNRRDSLVLVDTTKVRSR